MKKILSILIAIGLGLNLQAQICPLQEAVDFSATDLHGNKIHLFGILDSGQAVFIHFFINYNADPQLIPFITEAFHTMGCNTQDVFFMEISHRLTHQECQEWADQHHVAYPTITIKGKNLGTVVVFNALGQKIETFTDCGKQLRISTSQYQNGIYYIKNTQGQIGKMVVSH